MTETSPKIMEFPTGKMIAPGLFLVKADVGDKVYFFLKGFPIEGRVAGYFGHITPDQALAAFEVEGAKPAGVSNVGYCIEYFVPVGDGSFQKQVQLLDESEFFFSEEELFENIKSKIVRIPKGF